jgi:hypothetical protein
MEGTSTPPRASKDGLLAFDLNDISREPSDEQLAALMEAVVAEARRRGGVHKRHRQSTRTDSTKAWRRPGAQGPRIERAESTADRGCWTQRFWKDFDH